MSQFYFENILDELKNKTHPETCHFRKGNHPGPKWFLKTVCPTPHLKQIDKYGYGVLWSNIAQENPEIVKLVDLAYDWNGDEIPYMASVWIHKEYDIIVSLDDTITGYGLEVIMVDRKTGSEFYLDNLKKLVSIGRNDTKWYTNPSLYLSELDNIDEIADLMESEFESLGATHIRKKFSIVEGGKKKKKVKKKND